MKGGKARAVFQILSLAVLMIYGEYISQMEPLFNQLVVKLLFYPATFDSVHNLFVDRPFLNLFVLLIMVVFLSLAFVLLKRKWIKAYLTANIAIIILRFTYILGMALLPLTIWEYVSDEEVALINYNVDFIEDQDVQTYHDTYSLEFLKEEYDLTGVDLWEDKINRLHIVMDRRFGEGVAHPKLKLAFDLSKGDVITHAKYINRFETFLIYTPSEKTTEHDVVTLQLIGDGKVLDTYTFSKEPQMIPIDLKVDVDDSLELTINGQVKNLAKIALVGSKFSYEFQQK